jgi:effector-binding domain-containing protein
MIQLLLLVLMAIMLALAIWIVGSIFSSRVSEPNYERIAIKKGYEIRKYDPFLEAITVVDGTYKSGISEGFRRVGGYIFGNNTKKQSITMTAPVLSTAISATKTRISFVMPEGSKLSDMPNPVDDRVQLISTPSHTVAVLRFRGPINSQRIEMQEDKLLELLKKDGIKVIGKPRSARYNPPWTFPLVARNEIHVSCEYSIT